MPLGNMSSGIIGTSTAPWSEPFLINHATAQLVSQYGKYVLHPSMRPCMFAFSAHIRPREPDLGMSAPSSPTIELGYTEPIAPKQLSQSETVRCRNSVRNASL